MGSWINIDYQEAEEKINPSPQPTPIIGVLPEDTEHGVKYCKALRSYGRAISAISCPEAARHFEPEGVH